MSGVVGVVVDRTLSDGDRLLTTGEVAAQFRVDPKTVTRWASSGRVPSTRTPGGHRRFRLSVIEAYLADPKSAAVQFGTATRL